MWSLLLVILINGGASPTKFVTYTYATQAQCEAAMRKFETDTTYGYCSKS